MDNTIKTLDELQAKKKKLKMQIAISKREFRHSFGYTKNQTKDFLLQKVALPASAIGLATYGINKLTSSSDNNQQIRNLRKEDNFFFRMMPIILPLIQAYFFKNDKKMRSYSE